MNACLEFTGSERVDGYGRLYYNGKKELAHRVAWIEKRGSIPDGKLILHTCDNRLCIQNDAAGVYLLNGVEHPRQGHLWLGTNQDNQDDMYNKGRGTKARGEQHGRAKLQEIDVVTIRQLYATGSYSQRQLASLFNVTHIMIGFVVRRENWKHT